MTDWLANFIKNLMLDRAARRVKAENELFKPENDCLRALLREAVDFADKDISELTAALVESGWFERVRFYLNPKDSKDD